MPATDEQRAEADRIASAYDEQVRITPNVGPQEDRMTVSCPDGRMVVLGHDGEVVADSARLRPAGTKATVERAGKAPSLTIIEGRRADRGYDPTTDVLFLDQSLGVWTMIPPYDGPMLPEWHVSGETRAVRTADLRRLVADLGVWELRSGETEIRRAEG
jgi:hypothetical protein